MGFSKTNSKGITYYLHTKGGRLFYFSKVPADGTELPETMTVTENPRTGLPMVKRKA